MGRGPEPGGEAVPGGQLREDGTEALECYEESLELFQQLAQEAGTAESHDDLASIYYEISLLLPTRTGRRMRKEACRIWERLAQACPDAPQYAYKLRMARK